MSRRALVLRHVAFEGPGVLGALLPDYGFDARIHDIGVAPAPEAEIAACDLLVALGGPIGVYEIEAYPFLVAEQAAIAARLAAQKPTLGICLGAQLMAAALGARVAPGPAREIGYAPVRLTEAGRRSPLAPLDGVPVLHWHGDAFELPAGAQNLAFTDACPHQAFALESFALALQFHVEVEPATLESWLIGHAVELAKAGIDPRELRAQGARTGAATAAAGERVLGGWLDGAFA
jgi:GMP synthase (glutamine-hydrolysing)